LREEDQEPVIPGRAKHRKKSILATDPKVPKVNGYARHLFTVFKLLLILLFIPTPTFACTVAAFPKRVHYRIGEATKPGPDVAVGPLPPAAPGPARAPPAGLDEAEAEMVFEDSDCEGMPPIIDDDSDIDEPIAAIPVKLELHKALNLSEAKDVSQRPTPPKPATATPAKRKRRKARKTEDLEVETVNGTSWSAILHRLRTTKADVVLAQEHRCLPEAIAEASEAAKKLGWKSVWAPAKRTSDENLDDSRYSSGGVAIFARTYIGLSKTFEDEPEVISEARAISAKISAPGLGTVVVYSLYLVTGVGLNIDNVNILEKLAEHKRRHNLAWIAGADWNLEPGDLLKSGIADVLEAKPLVPLTETCISPACVRTLDYFLVSRDLGQGMTIPVTDESAETRPHRPVATNVEAKLKSATKTVFKAAKSLPFDPIIGPIKEPPKYDEPNWLAEQARRAFENGDEALGFRLYDSAFEKWAAKAEEEIANANDLQNPKSEARSGRPARIRVPLVPEVRQGGAKMVKVNILGNLLQRSQELSAALLAAWKHGEAKWDKLEATAKKIAAASKIVIDEESDGYAKKLIIICNDCELLAKRSIHLGPVYDVTPTIWSSYSSCAATVAAIRKDLTEAVNQERTRERAESAKAWDEWKLQQMEGSASGAHRFVKGPAKWMPPEVFDEEGNRAMTYEQVLEFEAKKYQKLWNATVEDPGRTSAANPPCEPLKPDFLRKMAKKFKRKTGVAPDGWHPRHYALLSDQSLSTLAMLYTLLEITGHLPHQQRYVCVFLLDKASGGTRPIGLFTSMYRLWAKSRQLEAARWAEAHDRPFFAAGKNRSTIDAVWRHSVLNQLTVAKGEHVAALAWDMRKFYEMISHAKLRQRAADLGFSTAIVDVAVNAYRMARVVTYEGLPASELFPLRGIVAGDSLSDILVKIYYLQVLDEVVDRNRAAHLDVYFDDLQLVVRGQKEAIVKIMGDAAKDLKKAVEVDMEATLATEKATITADDEDLCNRLRFVIGVDAGPATQVAQFLGVDAQLGRRRAQLGGKLKAKSRLTKAKDKSGKLKRLRTKSRLGAIKVFAAGVLPAAAYGAEALGTTDAELEALRKLALDSLPSMPRGSSRAAIFATYGDTTWRVALAPALRWAQEIWNSEAQEEKSRRCLSIPTIKMAWHTAKKAIPRNWGGSRGAVDAAFLALRRFGWSFPDPFTFKDDRGISIPLRDSNPKLLSKLFRAGVQRHWERKMASSLCKDGWSGNRVCCDHVKKFLNSKWSKANPKASRAAIKAFCGGTWTQDRAIQSGYDIEDPYCPLCHAAPDSLKHRLFDCNHEDAVHARNQHKWAMKRLFDSRYTDQLFAYRSIWEHPADKVELPAESGGVTTVWGDGADPDGQGGDELGGNLVFYDGSASRHPVEDLRRASWGVVFLKEDDTVHATVTGPVWRHLPQTPQSGEYLASVAAIQLMAKPTDMVGDCLGVVSAIGKLVDNPHPTSVHGGLLRDAVKDDRIKNVRSSEWMPSHTELKDDATQSQKLWHAMNDAVDKAAKDERLVAEELAGKDVLKDAEVQCNLAKFALRAIGTVFSKFPPLPRSVSRLETNPTGTLNLTHDWQHIEARNYWKCSCCGVFSHRPKAEGPPTAAGWCRPGRNQERAQEAERQGHCLEAVDVEGVPTVFCRTCGAHGSWLWRGLLANCPGKPRTAQAERWLALARQGIGPPRQDFKKANKRSYNRQKPLRPAKKAAPAARRPALANKNRASLEDRLCWSTLDGGTCRSTPWTPPGREQARTLDRPLAPAPPPDPPSMAPDLLPAMESTDGQPRSDVDCPRCAALVLSTDEACMQCGLRRKTAEEEAEEEANPEQGRHEQQEHPKLEPKGHSGVSSQNGDGKDGLSQNAFIGMLTCDGLPWHGGTFTPPPCLGTYNATDGATGQEPSRKRRADEPQPGPQPPYRKSLPGGVAQQGPNLKRAAEEPTGDPEPPTKRPTTELRLLPALEALRARVRLREQRNGDLKS